MYNFADGIQKRTLTYVYYVLFRVKAEWKQTKKHPSVIVETKIESNRIEYNAFGIIIKKKYEIVV